MFWEAHLVTALDFNIYYYRKYLYTDTRLFKNTTPFYDLYVLYALKTFKWHNTSLPFLLIVFVKQILI